MHPIKSSIGLLAFAQLAVCAAAPSGTYSALSMNVAGLPAILNSNGESGDKTTNTMIIGQVQTCFRMCIIMATDFFL
jgi:hypothetical protein